MSSARLTLVTDSKGFVHDVVKPDTRGTTLVQRVFEEMSAASGVFTVRTIADARQVTPDVLAATDILALYTSGDVTFGGRGVAEIDEWIRRGGKLLGVHSATTTLQKDPAFTKIIGGIFNGHPWEAGGTVTVKVHEPEHAAVSMFPSRYELKEEIYWHRGFDPAAVRVLMSLDMERTALKRPQHVPMVWCRAYGNGRILYTSLGHREDVWASPLFRDHLVASIEWLRGNRPGSATPNPELSASEQTTAERAAAAS